MQHDPENERKWYLAAKLLTSSLNNQETAEWEIFLLQDAEFRRKFEFMQKHWTTLETLPYREIDKEQGWTAVAARISQGSTKKQDHSAWITWRYAAVIIFCVGLAFFIVRSASQERTPEIVTTIEAPNGARTFVRLPDSSSVWLNAGSRLSFSPTFGAIDRNIDLEGEAFFDVRKNSMPFHIHTRDFDIHVLGTAFNVKAYSSDEVVSTTLIRGSLKIQRKGPDGKNEELLLHPNEKVTLRGTAGLRARQPLVLEKTINAAAEAEWKDGWLTVRGESLTDLSRKIERIYNVKVQFSDENLKNYRYNGRIQQLSLEQVLKALSLTSPVHFVIDGKNVTLSENPLTKSQYETQP